MTNIKPYSKKLGQNFLVNMDVVADLVLAGNVQKTDTVIEVGPGLGIVTTQLVKKAERVIAVEIDADLVAKLHQRFSTQENLDLINADILDLEIRSIRAISNSYVIVASLPYQITSPFLHRVVFGELGDVESLALILQKEVAERITAQPPKASYLSNLVNLYGQVHYIRTIPPTAFDPAPKVESAIVTITRHPERSEGSHVDLKRFSRFLHRGFSSPRKMLNKIFDPKVLMDSDIDPRRRAETLTLSEWLSLFKVVV